MATLRDLRRRIASIKSTQKITKAMELVAAAKMRRAQAAMEASRPYSEGITRVLANLASKNLEATHPFLQQREGHPTDQDPRGPRARRKALILITADRGLCGGLNTNAIRAANRFIRAEATPPKLVTVGRKGRDFFRRFATLSSANRLDLVADASMLPDRPKIDEILPAVTVAMDEFLGGGVDEVWMLYSRYVNAASQVPTLVRLIPPAMPATAGAEDHGPEPLYEFEPSPDAVLERLLPRYVEALVYSAVLENQASFQAAQMTAMRSASDNAGELIKDFTLVANKLRQAVITKELMEIVGGAEALAQAS
ncbi:MAG TPA: ATP synthase F1 subunit gamma [Candidatus Dormibacteraeota bacterium]|nr:ATP synthase F1 subunit gamma [Candidatus Dormibacteraeota bacterium]